MLLLLLLLSRQAQPATGKTLPGRGRKLHRFKEVFHTTGSLGLQLSSKLEVLGFASGVVSEAESKGTIRPGDRLVGINSEDIELTTLSELSAVLKTTNPPRHLYFEGLRQVSATRNQEKERDLAQDYGEDATEETKADDSTAMGKQHGSQRNAFSAVFENHLQQIGLLFDDLLAVTAFSRDSEGKRLAAELLGTVKIGDRLTSINHDRSIVESLLGERLTSLAVVQLLAGLPRPLILGFERPNPAAKTLTHSRKLHGRDPSSLLLKVNPGRGREAETSFAAAKAKFGGNFTCNRHLLRFVNPLHACSNVLNEDDIKGTYAIVMRGKCAFIDKVRRVQQAGAHAVIIMNFHGDVYSMTGTQPGYPEPSDVLVPVAMVENDLFVLTEDSHTANVQKIREGRFITHDGCKNQPPSIETRTEHTKDPGSLNEPENQILSGTLVISHHGDPRNLQHLDFLLCCRDEKQVPLHGQLIYIDPRLICSGSGTLFEVFNSIEPQEDKVPYFVLSEISGPCEALTMASVLEKHHQASGLVLIDNASVLRVDFLIQFQQNLQRLSLPVFQISGFDAHRLSKIISSPGALSADWRLEFDAHVVEKWRNLAALRKPSDWPASRIARRRLASRLLKIVGHSAAAKDTIASLASNADSYWSAEL